MTAIDPYRTLGLAPGASQAEIKRAYRQLAKLYHPDSAGERAVARFLVIQAAYEALVDEPGRPRPDRGGAAARPSGPPPPPWHADAARARATRDAYRARARRGATGATAGPSAGAPGGPARPSSGDSTGPRRPSSGDAASGGRSTRRRKATIGSTSYDGVEAEPFTPPWEGATWYGAGSGTYWTLNPKEYADPRKHGPEYLARSRRASTSARAGEPAGDGIDPTDEASDPAGAGDGAGEPAAPAGEHAAASAGESAGASAATSATSTEAAGSTTGGKARSPDRTGRPSVDGGEPGPASWTSRGRRVASAAPAGPPRSATPPQSATRPRAPTGGGNAAAPGLHATVASPAGLARFASTPAGRIGLAVLGWFPLGVALAAASDAVPACDGVATVCSDPLRAGIWPIHLLLIGLLAAVPRLGAIAAVGSIAFLGVGLVATPVLLVIGGAQTRAGTAAALAVVLVAAWLAGIALALSGRVDLPPWRGRRVR
jgi:curved DNA-binding protein CbpA